MKKIILLIVIIVGLYSCSEYKPNKKETYKCNSVEAIEIPTPINHKILSISRITGGYLVVASQDTNSKKVYYYKISYQEIEKLSTKTLKY